MTFMPGKYTVIADELNIRPQMDSKGKAIGRYFNGDVIDIYEVFPERVENGQSIIWGRNSENENPPTRYVALKVNLTNKVELKHTFSSSPLTLEERMDGFERRLERLEKLARI